MRILAFGIAEAEARSPRINSWAAGSSSLPQTFVSFGISWSVSNVVERRNEPLAIFMCR